MDNLSEENRNDYIMGAGNRDGLGRPMWTDSVLGGERAAIVKHSLDSDRQVSGRAMEELLTTDLTPELAKITAPTTVVWAWNSNMPVPAATFGGWYQAAYGPLKGVKVVRIDDSAHFIMIDQPAKFMAEVETFLAG